MYNVGDVIWVDYPFADSDRVKHRPAIVINEEYFAILAMYVTSKDNDNPYSIKIDDWREAGLNKESWARIDRIISIHEMDAVGKAGELSHRDLQKILQLEKEINSNKFHEFSIIAIRDSDNRYLQRYDENWNGWLFPYIRSTDNNLPDVCKYVRSEIEIDADAEYVKMAIHCKYSENDKVYKRYKHKLYKIELKDVPEVLSGEEALINGIRFKWMSIEDMEKDEKIMSYNDDVVAFVSTYCG